MKISELMQEGGQNREPGAGAQAMAGSPRQDEQQYDAHEGSEGIVGIEEPTEEEQEMYDKVVTAGLKVLNQASEKILKMLQSQASNPSQALADTTWTIMAGIDEKTGGQIDEELLLAAGAEVMENVGEYANVSGVFQVNQSILNEAFQLVLARFSEEFGVNFAEEMGDDVEAMDQQKLNDLVVGYQNGA